MASIKASKRHHRSIANTSSKQIDAHLTVPLPPFHSLLSLGGSGNIEGQLHHQPSNKSQHHLRDDFLLFGVGGSSLDTNHHLGQGESIGAPFADFYPTCQFQQQEATMAASLMTATDNHAYSQQFINPTDEFLFTAQQMAANLFDQCHQSSNISQHQAPESCSAFYRPNQDAPSSQLLYSGFAIGNSSASDFQQTQSVMPASSFSWSDVPYGTSSHRGATGIGKDTSIVSSSDTSDKNSLTAQERQTVLMLPVVNYRRRNERERERVRCVNDGYSRLREIIPSLKNRPKRISKVETLRAASRYIRSLQEALKKPPKNNVS